MSDKELQILEEVLRNSGLKYRKKQEGEEGGFFYINENGERVKWTTNIFTGDEFVER